MLKTKQKFGIKKLSVGVASVFMGLVGIHGTSVADASGESYKYITYKESDLTENELAQLNKTILDNSSLECGDTVHFVYKDKNGGTVTVDKEVLKADEKVESVVSKVLPQTNISKSLASVIGVIAFGGLTLALVRNRKTRKLLVVVLVATGVGVAGTSASAGENTPFNTLVTVDKAEQVVAPEYGGYEYVGYYLEKGFCSLEVINVTEDGTKITDGAEQNKDMYTFVKENVDPKTGQVTKVYHKIVTNYVDENNKIIETIDSKVTEHKKIDGYSYVTTETKDNGDIVHKYIGNKTDNPTIVYTDENEEVLTPENALDINKYTPIRESVDKDKNIITKVYHKITTTYKEDTGKVIETADRKEIAPKVVDGYTHTNTTVEDDGDVVHTYSKIPNNPTIIYVNKVGESVPKVDAENPNKYTVVEEKNKENGDIERVVHKIVTKYIDNKTGATIEEVEGKVTEHKEIPNYTYTTTELLDNGDIVHKYNKVPTITYIDEKGSPVDKVNAEDSNKYTAVSEKEKENGDIEKTVHKIVTKYVDNKTGDTIEEVDGKVTDYKEIAGHTYVTTETLDNGDIVHKYNKVPKIKYVTPEGEEIPDTDGADFEDEYKIIEERIGDSGETIRVAHKITTTYIDEKENTIEKVNKKVPNHKEIPNYTYVTTETKDNGDIVHKYSKNPTIVYVDEENTPITKENAENPELYTFVEDKEDNNPETETKVYHKIVTKYVDNETGNTIEEIEGKVTEHKDISNYTYVTTEAQNNGDIIHKYNKNLDAVVTNEYYYLLPLSNKYSPELAVDFKSAIDKIYPDRTVILEDNILFKIDINNLVEMNKAIADTYIETLLGGTENVKNFIIHLKENFTPQEAVAELKKLYNPLIAKPENKFGITRWGVYVAGHLLFDIENNPTAEGNIETKYSLDYYKNLNIKEELLKLHKEQNSILQMFLITNTDWSSVLYYKINEPINDDNTIIEKVKVATNDSREHYIMKHKTLIGTTYIQSIWFVEF